MPNPKLPLVSSRPDLEILIAAGFACPLAQCPAVDHFLATHKDARAILAELPDQARAAFGRRERLELGVWRDPDGGADMLVGAILTTRLVAQALRCLDILDQRWWLAQAANATEMLVTVDFRKGRPAQTGGAGGRP